MAPSSTRRLRRWRGGRVEARGVRLASGETLAADAFVSNADVAYTYLKLMPARFRRRTSDRRICGLRYSMSHFVLYFGTDRRYDHVAHHEILLGPRYRGCSTISSYTSASRATSRSICTGRRPPTRR